MFVITIPKEFTKADGKPFRKQKEGKDGKPIPILGEDKKPLNPPQYELEEASFLDMLTFFLNNVFDLVSMKGRDNKEIKPLKTEDSSHALDIFRAMHVAKDVIEVEKAPYEWLVKMLADFGADFFGVNAAIVLEPIKKAEEVQSTRAENRREAKDKK